MSGRTHEHFIGWLIAAFAFAVYLATLSGHYTTDGILYAAGIDRSPLAELIDPTHLLLSPVGWLWYRLWLTAGWDGPSLFPLQVLNALAGAISVGLLFAISRTMTKNSPHSLRISTVVSLGFAFSGGQWLLSVEAEFVTLPLATMLTGLWLILTLGTRIRNPRRLGFILGCVIGLVALTYLTGLFMVPATIVSLLILGRRNRFPVRSVIFSFLVTVTVIYIFSGLLTITNLISRGYTSLADFWGSPEYGRLALINFPRGFYAFFRSFGLFGGLAMNDSTEHFLANANNGQRISFLIYYLVLFSLVVFGLVLLYRQRSRLSRSQLADISVVLVWCIPYVIFAFYWVPSDISFWLPVMAAWWLLLAAGLAASQNRLYPLIVAISVIVVAANNYLQVIGPRRSPTSSAYIQTAYRVREHTAETDLIISDPDNPSYPYVAYFANRRVVAVRGLAQDIIVQGDSKFQSLISAYCLKDRNLYLLEEDLLRLLSRCPATQTD